MDNATILKDAEAHLRVIVLELRSAAAFAGRVGPIPHALNVAASHAQDALGQVLIAQSGGSLGVS